MARMYPRTPGTHTKCAARFDLDGPNILSNVSHDMGQEMRNRVMEAMREGFRPEFLNRIDEFVIFDRLSLRDMRKISALELQKVTFRLADKQITLEATDAALDFLSEVG